MTMKLTIKNDDSTRTAVATTTEISQDGARTPSAPVEIPPGETREFWIFSSCDLKLEEKQ